MLYISSLCTILPEPLRSTAPHQLCHVCHVRFGLLMTSLMLPHCLLIPRACCDPIAMCCAACDAAAADALPCDAQTRCELRIQLRTCGTLCANCASTPLHSSHFPYALPQHHLPLQDPSLDPMRVLHRPLACVEFFTGSHVLSANCRMYQVWCAYWVQEHKVDIIPAT